MEVPRKSCYFSRHWVMWSPAFTPLWPMAIMISRFSPSASGEGAPRVSAYSLQSLSTIRVLFSLTALSQLLSFIRSFAGQTVFTHQLLLQTSLCDRKHRIDISVLYCLSLLPLFFFSLAHTSFTIGIFPDPPWAQWARVAYTIPGARSGSVCVPSGHGLAVTVCFHSGTSPPLPTSV